MEDKNFCYKYPRAAVTTDSVVFGIHGKRLSVLLIERAGEPYKGSWAIPGGFLEINETVETCAKRELEEETGLVNVNLQQFHVFSKVDRDPRDRVLTVAFWGVVQQSDFHAKAGDDAANVKWFKISQLPSLAFDHAEIISLAYKELKKKFVKSI